MDQKSVVDGLLKLTLVYTGPKRRVIDNLEITPDLTSAVLERLVYDRIEVLDAQDQAFDLLPGAGDIKPVAPEPTLPPTQEEIDKATFLTASAKLAALNRAIALGVTKPDDQAVLDAQVAVKLATKPGYELLV
jgi:hypothetical protein